MFILGHAGITSGVIAGFDREIDLRWVAFAALLPDLVDKPLAVIAPEFANGWTRLVAHGLGGLAVFAAAVLALAPRRAPPLVVAYAVHLVLDRMWEDPHILFWPFLGFWFPPHPIPWGERMWAKIFSPWTVGGEVVGLAAIVALHARGRLLRGRTPPEA